MQRVKLAYVYPKK